MTDYEKLKQLLTEFGVEFEESEGVRSKIITTTEGSRKVDGYNSFYTAFEFNEDGVFLGMGAWE